MEYVPQEQKLLCNCNYKRDDWLGFTMQTDKHCDNIKTPHDSMKEMVENLNKAMLQAVIEII